MKFILEDDQLTVKLEGFEQLWALKQQIQIPHHAIEAIEYLTQIPSMQDFRGYLRRMPGTSIPLRFYAGTFKQGAIREFRYVKLRQPGVLVLSFKPGVLPYDRARLTCEPTVAQDIADWWQKHK